MSSGSFIRVVVLGGFAALTACGGGGGGSNAPAPVADTTAPDTTIGSAPNALTNQATAVFVFSATENGTYEGSLDGAAFTTVPNPFAPTNLADGAHTFRVRARDTAGNVDATPASHTWTIDTVAPVTAITGGPPAETTSTSATITFTTEAGTTVQAFTPTGGPVTVTSPLQLSGLTDGMKTVSLRALDAAGNLQLVAAERVWRVDTTAPTAQIVFPTRVSYTDEADILVRATVADAGTITAVSVNGVAATLLSGNNYTARVPVSPGDNTLTVSTTDSLGNTGMNATASIANRGTVIYDMRAMVWDDAGNRALVADSARHALLAVDGTNGRASIVSDDDHGTGPTFSDYPIALDAANNRVLALRGDDVLAIDLTTGNRTVVVTSAGLTEIADVTELICASPCTQLYATGMPSGFTVWEPAVFTINLTTGAQNVISGGDSAVGSGTPLQQPTGIVLDNSTGTLRALVSDYNLDAIFAVDLANGARTVVSSASPVGMGTALDAPTGLALDAANNRVFVSDNPSPPYVGRVMSVDLTNGNRTTIVAPGSSHTFRSIFDLKYDAANNRLIVPQFKPASLAQVPLGAPAVNRLSDSFVGTGATLTSDGSLLLDTRTVEPTLLASTTGVVVRISLLTGDRNDVVATTLLPGTVPFIARHLQLDRRSAPLADRLILGAPSSNSLRLFAFDSNAVFAGLSQAAIPYNFQGPDFLFDQASDRMIVAYTQSGVRHVIQPMDVATGTLGTPIAETPWASPAFGELRALAFDTVGGVRRLLAADNGGTVHSFSLENGARTPIAGLLGSLDAMDVNSAARFALLVSGVQNSVIRLDLNTGAHVTASGPTVGRGPRIMPGLTKIAADFPRDLVYVKSNEDMVLAVDLLSGERVITSR